MSPISTLEKKPGTLLHQFLYGSLGLLLACLCISAYVLCTTSLKKERERVRISDTQLSTFFDYQYRPIVEEMWTKNYEAIDLRVSGIAQQLGHAAYDVILTGVQGECVYSSITHEGPCAIPSAIKGKVSFQNPVTGRSSLQFDTVTNRYIYSVPLFLGAIPEGFLIATVSDPYEFYRGGSARLALRMFGLPITAVVLVWLIWLLMAKQFILKPYLSHLVRMEKKQALGELAAQVAHDIRSPLVALKSAMGSLGRLEESERRLITAAASRIESIANDLITQFSGQSRENTDPFCFLAPAIDSIIAEKLATLGERSKIDIRCRFPKDFKLTGIPISAAEIARVLSNLLNNAIESIPQGATGLITVRAAPMGARIVISISDNGKGISPDVLHKLRTVGGSYGKPNGAGMGLTHAKTILTRIGGSISMESESGSGTEVTLELPLAALPRWFCQNLDLSDAKTIVVLDDDTSVHYLWKERLGETGAVYLSDPEQFDVSQSAVRDTRYILDHEISGSPVTGMDLIQSYKLGARAILVTSHFNDVKIQRAIDLVGATILPKFMITSVAIEMPATPVIPDTPVLTEPASGLTLRLPLASAKDEARHTGQS